MKETILTINGGSSSIKFALFTHDGLFTRSLQGRIERIGLPGATLTFAFEGKPLETQEISVPDFTTAIQIFKTFLEDHVDVGRIAVVGHRVVHGMGRGEHSQVTPDLIRELKEISPIDPEHMPSEIEIMEMFAEWQPGIPQVACFDTVFHHTMPRTAQLLSLPRRFEHQGVRRYGFHGLSCAFVVEELAKLDPEKSSGRVIIAHLGNGASVTAIKGGASVDTSMGFTPTGGIVMSSRTGDIDPGALWYVMKKENLPLDSMSRLINHESGLLGVSGLSSNMLDLLNSEERDTSAREAVDLFCYQVKKQIGAYAAVLGGVDTIIFTGGMGENASRIRTRVCAGLEFLGVTIDESRNQKNEAIISSGDSSVCVRVIPTNEELMIAHIADSLAKK